MSKPIRVPSTTVELVQILGTILRDHVKFRFWETECWTFQDSARWNIYPSPKDMGDLGEWGEYYLNQPEYQMVTYLGSGYSTLSPESGNVVRVELRTRCELVEWVGPDMSYWNIQIWAKRDDGTISAYHFHCHRDYCGGRDIFPVNEKMPKDPPRKIAFWREETLAS